VPPLSKQELDNYLEKMYHLLMANPRMPFRTLASRMGLYSKTASRIYKEGLSEHILYPPMLRPRICTDYKEYVYVIKATDIKSLFDRLRGDHRVEYVTWCQGSFDLLLICNEQIDLSVETEFDRFVLSGERGNYVYPEVKRRDISTAVKEMNALLDNGDFSPSVMEDPLEKRGKEWSDLEQKIFRYLKHDIRKTFLKIQRELKISRTLLLKCYERVKKHSFITVPYYPNGYDSYVGFYLIMKTPHEQDVINLLGLLPAHSSFFRVKESLIAYVNIEKSMSHELLLLITKMNTHNFVTSISFSIPLYYWVDKGFSPG
jgi:hypothetical protein